MRHDVVIIGGGLGGLECGYILARQGLGVLVLEQGAQPGGCLQSYRRCGLSFDTGFHYVGGIGEGESLHDAFRYLDLLRLPWHRLDPDGFDRVTIGGRTFVYAQGYDEFAARMADDFPAERTALCRYAGLLRQASQSQWATLRPHATGDAFPFGWMERGAWDYLQQSFRTPLLRTVLSGTSLRMELRRESLPLFTFLHGQSGYIESSWRLRGDGSLLVQALADGIRAQGGDIRCNARVQELVEHGGRLTAALCADGTCHEGRLFISDIHPAQACRMVRGTARLRPAYRRRIGQLENTFGMFTLSLRIPPHTLPYFNCNHYVYRHPDVWDFYLDDSRVGGVLVSCRVPEDGSGYTRQVDVLTPMSWSRCRPWLDTTVGRRDEAYLAMKRQMAAGCMELAEQVLPGLREVSQGYTSTPLTWRDYTLTPEGSAYGVRKDFRQPLLTMLSPRTPIPNLLLTGQHLMLHGVQGVTMTAFRTCQEALGFPFTSQFSIN